ncbi:MAG: oligoendopeptidase F [Candidatus Nanohaloarchaea archaeon]|nr:oligoendopeptidase F [Candidatus Nanohaloarchaea archaeon]
MSDVPERDEIDERFKWALETVYDDEDEWEQDYQAVEDKLEQMQEYEGRLTEDAETLYDALQLKNEISRDIATLKFYAKARKREDTRRSRYREMASRADDLGSESASVKSFITPELEQADQDEVMSMVEQHDGLQTYDHYLDSLFRMAEHTLSKEQEEILSEIGVGLDNEQDVQQSLMNADIEFPTVETPDGDEVEVNHSSRVKLLKHQDREFREEVYRKYGETFSQFDTTLATNLHNKIATTTKRADIRGYDSSLHRALKGKKVPEEVYENLIETVKDNSDVFDRKKRLKQAVLGLDELKPWDGYMPVAEGEPPEIEYDEAKGIILEAMAPLGEDYVEQLEQGFEEGWIDAKPNKGKRSGAFSWGTYDTQPFLMMNYEDDLDSLYTLAHELGHSMHSKHANEHQEYVNANYNIFTAEVASTVHEALLTRHLLEETEDEYMRRHVLSQQLQNIEGTLFTQTMFADFEQQIHEAVEDGGTLTADRLDDLYGGVREDYSSTDQDAPFTDKGWMRIHHFYKPFYVYQYATGISAALSLTDQITDPDDPDAAERYRDFLRSGGSDYALNLLEDAGVDLSEPDPVEDAIDTYRDHLSEMEAIVVQEHQ